jgi:hypothetical protein
MSVSTVDTTIVSELVWSTALEGRNAALRRHLVNLVLSARRGNVLSSNLGEKLGVDQSTALRLASSWVERGMLVEVPLDSEQGLKPKSARYYRKAESPEAKLAWEVLQRLFSKCPPPAITDERA